jgi:hypothetical protein
MDGKGFHERKTKMIDQLLTESLKTSFCFLEFEILQMFLRLMRVQSQNVDCLNFSWPKDNLSEMIENIMLLVFK